MDGIIIDYFKYRISQSMQLANQRRGKNKDGFSSVVVLYRIKSKIEVIKQVVAGIQGVELKMNMEMKAKILNGRPMIPINVKWACQLLVLTGFVGLEFLISGASIFFCLLLNSSLVIKDSINIQRFP
jgi:hypothetical protein